MKPLRGSSHPKAKGCAPLPYVIDEDGTVCKDPTQAEDRWIAFFQAMEGGQRVGRAHQRQLWRENLLQLRAEQLRFDILDLPPLASLEAAFRLARAGKFS